MGMCAVENKAKFVMRVLAPRKRPPEEVFKPPQASKFKRFGSEH